MTVGIATAITMIGTVITTTTATTTIAGKYRPSSSVKGKGKPFPFDE
jgi:hypothetical protein